MSLPEDMYQCQTMNCGYIYDPDKGDRKGKIKKGTKFEDLPEDWRCPVCGATVKAFRPLAGPGSAHEESAKPASETGANKEVEGGAEAGMEVYTCDICGYQYNPADGEEGAGIAPGTPFSDVPDDYECPVCGAAKEEFSV